MTMLLVGNLPDGSVRYASIDQVAHHVESAVCDRRFGAFLRPFRSGDAAEKALREAGAADITEFQAVKPKAMVRG